MQCISIVVSFSLKCICNSLVCYRFIRPDIQIPQTIGRSSLGDNTFKRSSCYLNRSNCAITTHQLNICVRQVCRRRIYLQSKRFDSTYQQLVFSNRTLRTIPFSIVLCCHTIVQSVFRISFNSSASHINKLHTSDSSRSGRQLDSLHLTISIRNVQCTDTVSYYSISVTGSFVFRLHKLFCCFVIEIPVSVFYIRSHIHCFFTFTGSGKPACSLVINADFTGLVVNHNLATGSSAGNSQVVRSTVAYRYFETTVYRFNLGNVSATGIYFTFKI